MTDGRVIRLDEAALEAAMDDFAEIRAAWPEPNTKLRLVRAITAYLEAMGFEEERRGWAPGQVTPANESRLVSPWKPTQ